MTVSPERDLLNYRKYVAKFEDGSQDVFACPDETLEQGPRSGWGLILRHVAHEWQKDGYLKSGRIVSIRPVDNVVPFPRDATA